MAPFTPFLAEEIYRNLTVDDPTRNASRNDAGMSVHFTDFPVVDEKLIDEKLNRNMNAVREIVTIGLQKRAEAKIKVRQPLRESRVKNQELSEDFLEIICEELNVKRVTIDASLLEAIVLDTTLIPELKLEGEAREIIRAIQEGRKKAGFNVEDRIALGYSGKEKVFEMFGDMIAKEVLAVEMKNSVLENSEYSEEVNIEEEKFHFQLKRV
jgi:isoleucyl-tRNA synthetase